MPVNASGRTGLLSPEPTTTGALAGEFGVREVTPVDNSILSALPPSTLARLLPLLRPVELKHRQILQESHRPVERVYFIQRGMAVLFARTKRDGEVGVAMIGRAGVVGVPDVLGTMRSFHRCLMQVPGEALQIDAHDLRHAVDESPALRQQMMNFIQALVLQHSQTALCNARHRLDERLARWLLLAHDRLEDDTIPLTHDLLSMMLGVRRAGITTTLDRLERSGAVRKQRGAVRVVDRAAIERGTCECYRIIATEYERMMDFARRDGRPERRRLVSAE